MIYTITALIGILGAIGAWIYKLLNDNRSLKDKITLHESANKISEWANKLKDIEKRVQEDERDYEESKKTFDSNNPPSGAV